MKELLSEAPPCKLSKIRLEWLKLVNHLRLLLKKRNFPYSIFLEELLVKDLVSIIFNLHIRFFNLDFKILKILRMCFFFLFKNRWYNLKNCHQFN